MPRGPITSRIRVKDTDPGYKQMRKNYYESHKEEIAERMRTYYEKNKEHLRARRKQRYYENKARRLEEERNRTGIQTEEQNQ